MSHALPYSHPCPCQLLAQQQQRKLAGGQGKNAIARWAGGKLELRRKLKCRQISLYKYDRPTLSGRLNMKVQYSAEDVCTYVAETLVGEHCELASSLASMSYLLLTVASCFRARAKLESILDSNLGIVRQGRPSVFHMKRWNQYAGFNKFHYIFIDAMVLPVAGCRIGRMLPARVSSD
eukprot:scaffold10982_cov148-Skeletonema_dohrnii-CCMP3373.AAC.1